MKIIKYYDTKLFWHSWNRKKNTFLTVERFLIVE
jgi:hypothetical protein